MFPIGDDNSDRTIVPYINYAIIGLNILVFVLFQGFGGNDSFTYAFSLVPKEITSGIDLSGTQIIHDSLGHTGAIHLYPSSLGVYFNFLSSMFMHGGLPISLATCCSSGSLAITWRTFSATSGICSFTFCAVSVRPW